MSEANRINIHKPDFLPWQSAFLLVEGYLKDLGKDGVGHGYLKKRWYRIKYAPDKEESVLMMIRGGKASITVIIEAEEKLDEPTPSSI